MKKNILSSLILFLAMILGSDPCIAENKSADLMIRVCILDDKDSAHIILKRGFKLYAAVPEKVLMEGAYLNAEVTPARDGIVIGKRKIKTYDIKVKVSEDSSIYVDGRRFRGDIEIMRKENGRLEIINYLPLEDYLYGVLYHEVSHRWPMEALKTQAIAARTFALYQMRQNKSQPYDLRSDVYSQVYGGSTSEKWSTTKAVDATRGMVLTYNGDIFPAYYHATCAGRTEDAANLWGIDLAPLKSVECPYCVISPHYRWSKNVPLWDLEKILRNNRYNIDKIISVNILSKNKSGRIDKLEIKDKTGTAIILTGKEFRQLVGPNEVRSTRFEASIRWGQLMINGYGWGHGVGMCQWGAYGMSLKGKKTEEILKYYYPGSEITTIDKLKDKV